MPTVDIEYIEVTPQRNDAEKDVSNDDISTDHVCNSFSHHSSTSNNMSEHYVSNSSSGMLYNDVVAPDMRVVGRLWSNEVENEAETDVVEEQFSTVLTKSQKKKQKKKPGNKLRRWSNIIPNIGQALINL